MTKDPVCGMSIEESSAAAKARYQDKTYYFCSARCHENFQKNPQIYLRTSPPPSKR